MSMDSFICGSCGTVFHDIGEFLEHKKICIPLPVPLENAAGMQQPSSVEATVLDADGKSTTFVIINCDVDNEMSGMKEADAALNQLHNSTSGLQQSVAVESMSCMSGAHSHHVLNKSYLLAVSVNINCFSVLCVYKRTASNVFFLRVADGC